MTIVAFDPDVRDTGLIARLDRLRGTVARFPLPLIELGMRFAVGATFFRSGMLKLESFDTAIGLFRDEYRLPLLPPEAIMSGVMRTPFSPITFKVSTKATPFAPSALTCSL